MMLIDRIFNVSMVLLITWLVFKTGLLLYVAESVGRLLDGSFLEE